MARGSIQKRDQGYEVVVSLGRDPVTGKRRRQSRLVKGSKEDAERALTEMLSKHDRQAVTPSTGTVGQVLEAWYELAKDDLSPTTVRRYRGIIDTYLLDRWGDVKLTDLRLADVDLWYRALGQGDPTKKRRALQPASVRQIHAVLRRALGQGVRWGWLPGNPLTEATLPSLRRPDVDPPPVAEILAVLEQVDRPDLAVLFTVKVSTGMRRSEMCGLRWRDVDLVDGLIRVRRSVVQVGRQLYEKDTKTHAQRKVSIDVGLVALLQEHRARSEAEAAAAMVDLAPAAFVFSRSPDGLEPLIPDSVTQAWRRYALRAGVSGRLHDLRHASATELLGAGVDIRTVAERLGHRQTSTTLNIYAHAMEARDRDAADTMGRLLADGRSRQATRPAVG